MWMLLLLVVHLATAFPASWNESTACPHDALYSSLVQDGKFCLSVLEGNHCGAGYSTPTVYVRYNQTRIASYCECILTTKYGMTTSVNEAGTTRDGDYSDSSTIETSASVGQAGSGTYAETTTPEPGSTIAGSWNQTRSALTSGGETGDVPRTSSYDSSINPTTGTISESPARSTGPWNSTTTESPADTQGPFSAPSTGLNQTSDIPTSSLSHSGNQSQTLQSNTGVTSQLSDTHSHGMTRSGTTDDSLPWSIPGNSTSSPSPGGTRPTGSSLTGWNSSITISSSISQTGTFASSLDSFSEEIPTSGSVVPSWNITSASRGNGSVPTITVSSGSLVPFPTASESTDTGSLPSGSVGPIRNITSPSRGNGSVPTASIPSGTFVSLPTLSPSTQTFSNTASDSSFTSSWNTSLPWGGNSSAPTTSAFSDTLVSSSASAQVSSADMTSDSRLAPSWNSTSLPSAGNFSVPTLSTSSDSFVPFPTFQPPSQSSSADAASSISMVPSWNSTVSPHGGNLSVPTINISSQTFIPFPTQPFPNHSLTTDSATSGNEFPSWNSTSRPGGNFSIPSLSITRTGTLIPFPTLPLPSEPLTTGPGDKTSFIQNSSAVSGWNSTTSQSGGGVSVPTISVSQSVASLPFPFQSVSLPTVSEVTSDLTQSGSVIPIWSTTTGGPEGSGSVTTVSSSNSGPVVTLPTDSEILTSGTQSGGTGWNITTSIPGIVSVPTISVPASEIPPLPVPTDSWEVTASESVVRGGDTTSSTPGGTRSVTSFSSPVAATPTPGGASNGSGNNATTTGVPEFPAANFTHVTRTAALSQETCYFLPVDPEGASTRRALLYNARLREDNVSIPIPYIESVEFEKDGVNPLYLTVRDEEGGIYFVDISHRGRLSVVDPDGYIVTLDAEGIHFSGSNCTHDISITIDDMYEQIADLAGVQCAALKRQKRAEDLDFSQTLYLHDQCGNPIDRSLRQYPQLLVGDTVCADVAVDRKTGRWDFECTFPGSESGSLRCQWAIRNKIIDFISTDPFGGSCPDLSTVVTTLEQSGQDIVDPSELRKDLANQGLSTDRAKQEADAAVIAYTQLWKALGAIFTKGEESSKGALEEYIDVYNTHRSFENDICQSLHEDEIPLNLTLIAGATHIPAITTLNWAPESTRPYNITVQDSSRIACCPNSGVAEGEGATCAYPREAIIPGTGCVCGKSAGGVGIAFEWTECDNYAGSCEADGDCGDGYLCLTGSCCGTGVCVDAFACSENGTGLVYLR